MKLLILASLTVIFVATIGIFFGITLDDTENSIQDISKTKITDVIPGVVLGEGSYSIITTNIADVAHKVVYTIEGEILEFGEPILHTDSQNRAHGAIPVTMSVDKLHKGTLDSDTFTFFLDSDVWLYPGEYLEGDELALDYLANHSKIYSGTDYTDVPKSYSIRYHSDLFEIGDKIIAHFKFAELSPIRYIYEKDYGVLDEFYTIPLGKWGYYNVGDDGIVYGGAHHNSTVSLTRVLTESLSSPISENENNTQNILESTKNPIYVPSDITKANPNFVVVQSEASWLTTNIADVKDQVVYTLQGTVLSIDDPIDYNHGGPVSLITGTQQIIGFIPVTISIDNVYKGKLTDNEFTFYLFSDKYNDQYHIPSYGPNFKIGENVLVHLAHSDLGSFPDGHYYVKLAEFGKYQLQPIGTSNANSVIKTDDIEYIAFNVHHPNGIPLDVVAGEALP